MANRRVAKPRSLSKVRPRPAPLPVRPPAPEFDDALVEQITGDILQHLGAANSQSVEVRAEIGRLLLKVRTELPHGAFRPYLREHVPFDGSTAERAMNLHRFAEKQPTLFGKLKPLGVSKANALIKLPVDRIESGPPSSCESKSATLQIMISAYYISLHLPLERSPELHER